MAPVASPIQLASASSEDAAGWCAAALPRRIALRSPESSDVATAFALSVALPCSGAWPPFWPAIAVSWHGQSNLAYVVMPEPERVALLISMHPDGMMMGAMARSLG